ncbi:MAG: SAM-dependent methyltransferase [Legionella sp.]|nr:SAM-dependent methyltransferase [Legionella sp.]
MSLIHTVHQGLNKGQVLPFVQFMQMVLYAPGDGYYSSNLPKFGKQGDFITAPELTPLFGKTLANQCHQIMSELDSPIILEYGAGTGKLCVDILRQLDELHGLPEQYLIMEVSASLRLSQQTFIKQSIPHLAHKIRWLDELPAQSFEGLIIANEVLDAMPVHRFLQTEEGIFESYIAMGDNNALVETFLPCQNHLLVSYICEQLQIESYPYLSEVNLFIEGWIFNNHELLKKGVMILIDYGFPRHEYYHPDRNQGTLMCHYKHQAHTNFLQHVGEQDITAHVDFTHVAEAAFKVGFHVAGFTNQASFLLSNGLLNFLNPSQMEVKAKQAIKKLTHPSEMGELFKVMALSKEFDIDLQGFQLQDKRVSL